MIRTRSLSSITSYDRRGGLEQLQLHTHWPAHAGFAWVGHENNTMRVSYMKLLQNQTLLVWVLCDTMSQ